MRVINLYYKNIPVVAIAILIGLLIYVTIAMPYKNGPPIRSDGAGYHVWVYGILNLDFSFCKYESILNPTGSISVRDEKRSVCGIKYPPGVGMFQTPFVAYWADQVTTTEYPDASHTAILWIGAVLLLFVSIISYKTLSLLSCSQSSSLIAIGAYLFGSGLFHYSTYDASFSHVYSTFGVSVLLYIYYFSANKDWNLSRFILFIAVVFWLHSVRQTNGAITFAIAMLSVSYIYSNSLFFKKTLFAWGIGAFLGIILQLVYNYYVTGEYRLSSYGQEGFPDIGAHFADVIMSYERGLVNYYPVFALTVGSALISFRSGLSVIFIGLILLLSFVYGSWHSWFLGGGMGHRGFVELAPIGILVLGMALDRTKSMLKPWLLIMLILSVYVTTSVMLGYWSGAFPFAGTTSEIYWRQIIYGAY